jgi:2-phosphoglycerate kinase
VLTAWAYAARMGRPKTIPTLEQLDLEHGFAYSRGLMVPWLMTTGLSPDRALDLARRVEDRLAASGRGRVSLDELEVLAHEVLGEDGGDQTAERFPRRHDLDTLGRPLVVLIGGGTGVGKSTVATQLAHALGITRVSSTDFIRQVLRAAVPEGIAPELSRSSFELDQTPSRDGATAHAEFERQATQVLVGVRAAIERAVRDGVPLIVEGIHLIPGLVDLDARDSLTVHVVLSVEDDGDHLHRFTVRAGGSARPAGRYETGLGAIRRLQAHVVAAARTAGVPVVENHHLDATVRRVLDLIFAAVDGVLAQRGPEPMSP